MTLIRISRTLALLIGAATVWPLIYMIGFMASVVFILAQTASNASAPSTDTFRYTLVLHMITMGKSRWID